MKRMFFGWLVRELEIINAKLDEIIEELEDSEVISRDTSKLKRSSDKLQSAINKQQKDK